MTDKVNLPVRKFIEQKISDNFQNIDFRRGTAFNDLFAKPAAMLFQPFRHELNMLKINQSILNFDNMAVSDVNLLLGNIFIKRASASQAIGTVRIYFRDPGIYRFDRIVFTTQSGLRFLNLSTINTTTQSLIANRSDDGLYYLDIVVQAESPGSQYSVKSGEIQLIENQPSQILKVENIDDFGMVTDEENNAQLYAKARRSIAVRNLINNSSIQSVLFNEFPFIRDIFVVGASSPEMIRDLVILPTVPPTKVHIGGMTDIYIDTTGITAYELNIASIPETGVIDCVGSAASTLLFKYESGVIDDTYFFDFNNLFFSGTTQLVTRGNRLRVISTEFGNLAYKDYNVEQVLDDNRIRISGGIKSTNLDGVVFESGNIIYDFIGGLFSSTGILKGDYLSYGPGDAWKLNNVYDEDIEVSPSDSIIINQVFNNEIVNGQSSFINFGGIGGVLSSPTEVKVGDFLQIISSNAWGRYNVYARIDADNILVFPESATVTSASIVFNGTNQFTGSIPIGTYVTVNDVAAVHNGASYLVIAANTFDRVHGEGTSTRTGYKSNKIISENIPVNTPFKIVRKMTKTLVTTTGADALTSPTNNGDYFFVTGSTSQYKLGDEVNFGVSNVTVVGIQNGVSKKIQVSGPITAHIATYIPTLYRYAVNNFQAPTVIFNRYVHTGQFQSDLAVVSTNATWTRVTTTATVTTPAPHGFSPGKVLHVSVSSDTNAIVTGNITLLSASGSVFTFACLDAGAAAGSLTFVDGFSTIAMPFVGINSWPSYKFIIHSGNASGIYTIDASNVVNPNSVTLSDIIFNSITAGDQYSIAASTAQVGSAHGDVLYVPTYTTDLSLVSGTFPNTAVTHFVHIVNGANKGVYEVASYLDANRIQINGTIANTGANVVTQVAFGNAHSKNSTVITEPGTPFVGVTINDTLVIDRSGTLAYHNVISNTANNSLTIFPALTDDTVAGSSLYTIIHDTMNPFVITSSQTSFEIHALPKSYDRRSEGYHGQCVGSTFIFSDPDINFPEAFNVGTANEINPAGYELYILSGTHARTDPYIIASISGVNSLLISNATLDDSTTATPNFSSATGFIGGSSPANSEQYEIKKLVSLLSPVSYELSEDYTYFDGTYFKLPILALRDITLIDPVTGELSATPLVEPTDYSLGVKDASTRYSILERSMIQFTDPISMRYKKARIRYYSDPNVQTVHAFCDDPANRITNNSILLKRMESTFVEITISIEGNVDIQTAQDTINSYITTRKSKEPIEASDIIQALYGIGVTYVDTDTLSMTSIYYASDGTRYASTSRTRIVSASTATYIPGVITINLIATT